MPLAAFTFGSLGDIIAVIQLANQVRDALREASGSSRDIQALVSDFDRFTLALEQVKAVLTAPEPVLQPNVRAEIDAALGGCEAVLLSTQRLIRAFEARITRRDGRSAWRAYWAALAWEVLGGRRQVDALRARLGENVRVIMTYLLVSQSRQQTALREAAGSQHASLQQIRDAVEDIQRYFGPDTPSFMFYDEKTDAYYQPCIRTSAHRHGSVLDPLMTVYQVGEKQLKMCCIKKWLEDLGEANFTGRHKNGFSRKIWLEVADFGDSYINCFFFMSSFGEVHVLVGAPPLEQRQRPDARPRLLKNLLNQEYAFERPGSLEGIWLRDLYPFELRRAEFVQETVTTYSNFVNRFFPLTGDDEPTATRKRLINALRRYPDPEHLNFFLKFLEQQRLKDTSARNDEAPAATPDSAQEIAQFEEAVFSLLDLTPNLEASIVSAYDLDNYIYMGPSHFSFALAAVTIANVESALWLHPLLKSQFDNSTAVPDEQVGSSVR